jgi:predicted RNase H-like nuclease (RuvC/YqgF family)
METPDWLKKVGIDNLEEVEESCKKQEKQHETIHNKFIDSTIAETYQEQVNNRNKTEHQLNKENNSLQTSESRISNSTNILKNTNDNFQKEYHQKAIMREEKNIHETLSRIDSLKDTYKTEIERKNQTDEHVELIKDNPINLN